MKFIVETSARHIHVTERTLAILFGEGHTLTNKKDLSQPGQFACEEKVKLVGPKGEMNVSILGPVRKADQVELSFTDARTLGLKGVPVRCGGYARDQAGGSLRRSGDFRGRDDCQAPHPHDSRRCGSLWR